MFLSHPLLSTTSQIFSFHEIKFECHLCLPRSGMFELMSPDPLELKYSLTFPSFDFETIILK